jgi:hypothetical protein
MTLSPLTTYLYGVRARNGTGVSEWAADPTTTFVFTDPVLTVGETTAKATHISELQQAVLAMRTAAELPAFLLERRSDHHRNHTDRGEPRDRDPDSAQ